MKKIIHVDMDSFFASVELLDRPDLIDKPVAIGGTPKERGVLCTANYVARTFGVRSAMSSAKALKICPELVLIPPNFEKYERESAAILEIFSRFTDKIEPLSLDEAFLDVTSAKDGNQSAVLIAEKIRELIKKERNLTASAGVSINKLLAKIASDQNKPDGMCVILPHQISEFVKKLPCRKLFGVGEVTEKKLLSMGIKTCGDLQKIPLLHLRKYFGNFGSDLYYLSRGIDDREVIVSDERKSIAIEHTYPTDLATLNECIEKIPEIYNEWMHRFENLDGKYKIKTIFAKVKFSNFKHTTMERSTNLRNPAPSDFIPLLTGAFLREELPVRLLGIGAKIVPQEEDQQLLLEF